MSTEIVREIYGTDFARGKNGLPRYDGWINCEEWPSMHRVERAATRRVVRFVGAVGIAYLLVLAGSQAAEDFKSGNWWLGACRSTDGRSAMCLGFIVGATEAVLLAQRPEILAEANRRPMMCFPSGVTYLQMQLIVVKYLEAHPQMLHEPFIMLALVALQEAFPCR